MDARWYVYAIGPIDHGWERCPRTVLPNDVKRAGVRAGWEGDSCEDYCVALYLPDEDYCELRKSYLWKQSNNGTCFLACPFPLDKRFSLASDSAKL